ncbi:unnamed protein product [Mytilus edulis]|uniref:Helicase ATP-binding domain-containing protein n=1 Tax=Mytilus edulis TaxID=6550 RepID=A0A8S3SZ17_MYTED|nr:unnamed protein product [Mytilus edulis]
MASKSDIDVAIDKVLTDFKISTLKAEQRTILDCLIEKKDCMAILPTGFGKSLPYQMLVSVRRELEKETSSDDVGKVIVCSPLVALMADQVDRINAVPNVTAAYRGACSNGDDDILKGKFDYLFASPETLISDKKWRMTLQQMNVSLIVVDEFHTICTWGGVGEQEEETAFRKWFRYIGELRSMFTTANLLALSATCTTTMRKRVMRELHMHKDLTTIISKSPNKPNIKFCVQKIDNTIDMSMVWLVDALEKLKIDFPRTIIYSNTIKQLSELYSYLCTENPDAVHLIDMFHSETPEEKKKL